MTRTRQAWTAPELIVLARNKPEEAVLSACKNPGQYTGPGYSGCKDLANAQCIAMGKS